MGTLLLTLACSAGSPAPPSLEYAAAHFSPDLVRCLALLLGAAEGGAFSWRHMAALTGERLMMEMDSLAMFNDNLVGGRGGAGWGGAGAEIGGWGRGWSWGRRRGWGRVHEGEEQGVEWWKGVVRRGLGGGPAPTTAPPVQPTSRAAGPRVQGRSA
jgi:hypothetical protein